MGEDHQQGGVATHREGASRRPRPRRGAGVFVLATVISFLAMALWSVATPLYAAPDEPVHVIKAAAVVRGELVGDTRGAPSGAFAKVDVPAFYGAARNRSDPACFHDRPEVPASCAPALSKGSGEVASWIYVAHYPPLYYALVGLPTLLGQGTFVLYLMRLVSALCSSVLVGLAAMCAICYSASRLVLVGGLVACTPMVLFLGGVVNPNGLEVAAALCVWTSGAVLVTEHADDPPPLLVGVLGASACVLELTRSLSPFWLALTALVLFGIAEKGALRRLLARPAVRLALVVVAVVGAGAVSWVLAEHATSVAATGSVAGQPASTVLETSIARTDAYVRDMVGVFGWLDTDAPLFTYVTWYGLVAVVGLLAAAVARRRQAVVLGLLALAVVAVPVAISASQAARYGYVWQGRDTLPLAVGLPVVGGALLGRSLLARAGRRLAVVAGAVTVLAQGAAFFEALRRYAVGTGGPDFSFVSHASWQPPLGFAVLLPAEAAVLVLLAAFVARAVHPAPERLA